MNTPPDLLKAIRTGQLAEVIAALDAGAPIELDDGKGNPGLPLAIACFMGHAEIVRERHRHDCELNPAFVPALEKKGMIASGVNPDSQFVEAVEIKGHPWFVGVIYHPEFRSRPVAPHPLFKSFIEAIVERGGK